MYSLLYVDDEPGLLEIGKLFLEQTGDFTVTCVLSAKDALSRLQEMHFDAIVADYQMPGMSIRTTGRHLPNPSMRRFWATAYGSTRDAL